MKACLPVASLILACLTPAWSEPVPLPAIMQIGELPGQKKPALLRPKERNPFTRRETKPTQIAADRESEESKLRALFKAMSVTGVIRGGGTTKVLLENLILKPGQPLPPLIDGQTETLVVGAITANRLELAFVETDERAEPRKILIPIDLRPQVTVLRPEFRAVKTSTGTMRSSPVPRETEALPEPP